MYPFNFQQVASGVSCHEWWKYLRALYLRTGRGESLKIILDCALSEEAPYFLWIKCADFTFEWPKDTVEWKLIKFDLFGFKFFPQVVQKH